MPRRYWGFVEFFVHIWITLVICHISDDLKYISNITSTRVAVDLHRFEDISHQ